MISVLTPSYQYGRFLEEAIWSVEGQSGEIEHVVQDAMSTDATESVLARHPRLRAVREPDSGQSDALARALARSSGEWVGWLNADEFYLPEAFEMIAPAMRDPRVDVVLGDAVMVDEAGRFLRLLPTYVPRGPSLGYYGPVLASCATFVRREWLERFLWDTELRWVMDWDLWLRLRGAGARFCHVSATLAAYRVHAGQVTQGQSGLPRSELRRLRQRSSLVDSGWREPVLRLAGQVDHVRGKTVSGAYLRQVKARRAGPRLLGWGPGGFTCTPVRCG